MKVYHPVSIVHAVPSVSENMKNGGTTYTNQRVLRPTCIDNLPDLRHYFNSMSEKTRRLRFQTGMGEVPDSVLSLYEGKSTQQVFGFALYQSTSANTIIGEGLLARSKNTTEMELGVSLADSHQNCGLGKFLISKLIERAVQFGYQSIHADSLRDNIPLINAVSSLGFTRSQHPDDWSQVRMTFKMKAVDTINTGCNVVLMPGSNNVHKPLSVKCEVDQQTHYTQYHGS